MTYEIEYTVGPAPDTVWAESAVARLVGQRPVVNGAPGEVLAAWQDELGVHIRVRAEGEPPDVSGIIGYSVGPDYWRNRGDR